MTEHDDTVAGLESELRSLQLRAPSARLMEMLAAELTAAGGSVEARSGRAVVQPVETRWAGWTRIVLPIAAAVVFGVLALHQPSPASLSSTDAMEEARLHSGKVTPQDQPYNTLYKPVRAENWAYDSTDEGVVTLPDGTPARQLRSRYVDTITWSNASSTAQLKWSVPREEIRLIPIRAY